MLGEDASAFSMGAKSAVRSFAASIGMKKIADVEVTANQIMPAIFNPLLFYARQVINDMYMSYSYRDRFSHDVDDLNETAEDFGVYVLEAHLVNEQKRYVAKLKLHHAQFKKGYWNKQIQDEFLNLCEMTKASVAGFLHALDKRGNQEKAPTIPYLPNPFIEDIEETETERIEKETEELRVRLEEKQRRKDEKEKKEKEKLEKKEQEKKAKAAGKGGDGDNDDAKSVASEDSAEMTEAQAEEDVRKFLGETDDDDDTEPKKPRVARPITEEDIRKENIFKRQATVMANYFIYDFNLRYKHKVLTEFRITDRNIYLLNKARRKHMTGITNRASVAFGNLIVLYGDAVRGKKKNYYNKE